MRLLIFQKIGEEKNRIILSVSVVVISEWPLQDVPIRVNEIHTDSVFLMLIQELGTA